MFLVCPAVEVSQSQIPLGSQRARAADVNDPSPDIYASLTVLVGSPRTHGSKCLSMGHKQPNHRAWNEDKTGGHGTMTSTND
jgi:hypothetical protein